MTQTQAIKQREKNRQAAKASKCLAHKRRVANRKRCLASNKQKERGEKNTELKKKVKVQPINTTIFILKL